MLKGIPTTCSASRFFPAFLLSTIHNAQGQSHCLLLVEPVILPDLGHTGVRREILPDDHPIFYMDGHKSCGLSATVHKALYESTCNRKQKELGDRDQQLSLEQSDSSVCTTPFDYPSRMGSEDEVGAITKGHQGGKFPSDVSEETRLGVRDTRKHRSGMISTNKTSSSTLGHVECEEGGGQRSLSENTAARLQRSGTLLIKSQQQHQQPVTHSEGDTSALAFGAETSRARTTSHKKSSAPGWRRQDELRGGGRDSEWSKERRAADQEAREVLGAVRQNSLMMSFLVGGGI